MTREEAIEHFKEQLDIFGGEHAEAIKVAIEALEREPSEDGTLEVKVEDATKVGRVLISDDKHRGGLYYPDEDEPKGEPMKTTDYCDICKRDMCEFCVADNANPYCVPSHYEIKQDEPQKSDLISRADAIEALGEEPLVWCNEEYEIAERSQWRADIEAIKSVPSADRPTDEFDGMIFSTDKYMAFVDKKEIHILRKGAHKVTVERTFNTEDDDE